MQKYTIERFNDFLGNKAEQSNVNELLLESSKQYYGMVRYINKDYVTKAQINEGFEKGDFDRICEQSAIQDAVEMFALSERIEEEAVWFAIEQREAEFLEYLKARVDEIAKAANEEE